MADQLLSPFVGKLLDYIAVPVGRLCSYPLRYNANMEEFRSQLSGLETRRNDVKLRVDAAERKGEVILPSVEAWLKRVDAASDESKGFVEEEDGIGKRCFNGPLNLKVRYQRSRKAKKKVLDFDAIKKDGTFDDIGLELTGEGERGRARQLLQRLLVRKKILIVLDDIWASIDLNAIGIPRGSQQKDCKIILTTRKRDVCEKMGARKIFQIE